jgi:hypothetical protein
MCAECKQTAQERETGDGRELQTASGRRQTRDESCPSGVCPLPSAVCRLKGFGGRDCLTSHPTPQPHHQDLVRHVKRAQSRVRHRRLHSPNGLDVPNGNRAQHVQTTGEVSVDEHADGSRLPARVAGTRTHVEEERSQSLDCHIRVLMGFRGELAPGDHVARVRDGRMLPTSRAGARGAENSSHRYDGCSCEGM